MSSYERVTYRPEDGKRARRMILADPRVGRLAGAPVLTGVEADKDGNHLHGGADGQPAVERRHIIALDLVTMRQPIRVDPIYGEWVDAGKPPRCSRCGMETHYVDDCPREA